MANVEDYEVLDWVGGGSFGSVSRVRRKHDDAVVCWKRVQYGGFSEAEKRAVVAEVNCLRELHSPFVVRFLDRVVDRKTTTIYIVMEYCEGGDLAHLLEGLRKRSTEGSPCFLEESKLWRLAAQLLLGLHACHYFVAPAPAGAATGTVGERRVILHRDLKPANVLLDKAGNAKLGDFGMSKNVFVAAAASHRADPAALSLALGTPNSMSPEAVNGEAGCAKSDVWALGCVLYEAASLRPPFVASNPMALAVAIDEGHFPRLPERYSDTFANFVSTLLTHARAERPTVGALLGLEQHISSDHAIDCNEVSSSRSSIVSSGGIDSSVSRGRCGNHSSSATHRLPPLSTEVVLHGVGPCLPLREALVEARGLSLRLEAQAQLARQMAWKRDAHQREAALAAREAKLAEREAAITAAEAAAAAAGNVEEEGAVGAERVTKACRVDSSSSSSSSEIRSSSQHPAPHSAHGPQATTVRDGRDVISCADCTPRRNRSLYPSAEARVLAAFSSSFSAAAAVAADAPPPAAPAAVPSVSSKCRDSNEPLMAIMQRADGTAGRPDGSDTSSHSLTALLRSPGGTMDGNNSGRRNAGNYSDEYLEPDGSALLQGNDIDENNRTNATKPGNSTLQIDTGGVPLPAATTLLLASGEGLCTRNSTSDGGESGSGSATTGTGFLPYSSRSTSQATWLGAGITTRPGTVDSTASGTGCGGGSEYQQKPSSATVAFATGGVASATLEPSSHPEYLGPPPCDAACFDENVAVHLPVPVARTEERGTKRPMRGPSSAVAAAAPAPRFLPQPPPAAPAMAGGRTGFAGRALVGANNHNNNINGGGGAFMPGCAPQHRRRKTLTSAAFKPAHEAMEPHPRPPPAAPAGLEVCGHGYLANRAGPGKENGLDEGPTKRHREA